MVHARKPTNSTECAAICLRGPDTGNLRCSVPGEPALWHHTNYWFKRLSVGYGFPLIPVINSANKAGIFIENVQDQALTAVPFALVLARLPGFGAEILVGVILKGRCERIFEVPEIRR